MNISGVHGFVSFTVILLFCCSFTIKQGKLEHQKYFWHVIVLQ